MSKRMIKRTIRAALMALLFSGGAQAQTQLDTRLARLRGKDLRVRGAIRGGLPLDEIVAAASEERADLLVLGHDDGSRFGEMLFGSLADPVLQKTGEAGSGGQLGESRHPIASGHRGLGHEQAREQLPPAIGTGGGHADGPAAELASLGDLPGAKLRVADADLGQHLRTRAIELSA